MQATINRLGSIPSLLQEIPDPPKTLWIRGRIPAGPAVAIVGTRKPTQYGRRITAMIASRLGQAGFTIISGLAFGVDAIAHAAALDAGGATVAVLPSGLEDADITPQSHLRLAERIEKKGALLSEYETGTSSRNHFYEARNRLISGLAGCTVVTEASRPSGSLITARHAGNQSRDVWAIPGPIDSEQSIGTNWLIENGAWPLVSISVFLESIGAGMADRKTAGVAKLLAAGPLHFEELAARSKKTASGLEAELAKLELLGAVRHLGERYYSLP